MEKFRASTKYILWVLILSFGVLWALADTNVFDAIKAGPRSLGEVNGKAISFEAYNQKVQSFTERYRYETGESASSETKAYYEEAAWDELVLDVIIKEKMDELGIKVTDNEIVDMITGPNPDPFIAQQFTREDGTIDREALNAAIAAPQNTQVWIMIEQQLRDKRRREKLAQYVQSSIKVSDAEVLQEYKDEKSALSFDYVRLAYSDTPDSLITVSESDLKSFYNKEINRYQRKKTWKFNYAEFDLTPTAEDTARTYSDVQQVREELSASANDSLVFAQFLSVTPYTVTKVDKKEVKELYKPVLSVGLNQTTEVIKEENGLLHTLKKVAETKKDVSFIDFSLQIIADPYTTVDERAKAAGDLAYYAEESNNKSLTDEAERRGIIVKNSLATEDTPFIAGLGQSQQIINWLKSAKKGEITQNPLELSNAIVVVQLTDIEEAGARPFEEVRAQVERLYKTEKRKSITVERLQSFANGKSNLAEIAKAGGLEVKQAENVRFNADIIPSVGREPVILGAATQLDTDQISKAIAGEFGAFILKISDKKIADEKGATPDELAEIKSNLEQQRNMAISQVWIDELKNAAKIKDYRSLVLRAR